MTRDSRDEICRRGGGNADSGNVCQCKGGNPKYWYGKTPYSPSIMIDSPLADTSPPNDTGEGGVYIFQKFLNIRS